MDDDAELARKLAEMQSNAQNMNQERLQRIAELEAKEKAMSAVEENERMKNSKYGGQAKFLSGANKKAQELDLGERVRRGRQGMGEGRDQE